MTAPKIVGVVFSRGDLERARRMRRPPDFFELRLDRLRGSAIGQLPAPLIITARDPHEGGANNLPAPRRRALLLEFLPGANYVDVELRSARSLRSVLRAASENNIRTIISFHDFDATPSVARLDGIVSRARSLGATLIKIATRTDTPEQLERLLDFFERHQPAADVVAMGIGKLGRTSRLKLAQRGCILNYAHLGSRAASGQLSVEEVRRGLIALTRTRSAGSFGN